MLELRNVLNIKEYSEKLRSEKVYILRYILKKKTVDLSPPPPDIARHGPMTICIEPRNLKTRHI
jgi:hypothetical protein